MNSNLKQSPQIMEYYILTPVLYFISFLLMYCTTKNLLNKLNNLPPSPFFILPIIGHIHLLRNPVHKQLYSLSKKYGDIFYLHLGHRQVLVVNSPSAAEDCFSKNDIIFANRPRLLAGKYLGYNYTSIGWAPYGDYWRSIRKLSSTQLLSTHQINALSQVRMDDIRAVIRRLFLASSENPGNVVDLRSMIVGFLYNAMTGMIVGKRFYEEEAVISPESKEFQDIIDETQKIITETGAVDYIKPLTWFRKAEKKHKAIHERRDIFFQDLILKIRGRDTNTIRGDAKMSKSITQVLMSLSREDPDYYTDEFIKSNITVLLQGGSETSIATTEWAMTLLLNNPVVLEKVQDEINSHVGTNRLIDDSDISMLPYLNCVIKETLRLYPVIPLLVPHESSKETIVGGFHVPCGTMLFVNVWAIHHDPIIWEDPLVFKPERFMLKDGKTCYGEFTYMPFGKGRRGCPGEALAMRTLSLAVGSLVQCFEWRSVNTKKDDLAESCGVVITKNQPLIAKCSARPRMMNLLSQSFLDI